MPPPTGWSGPRWLFRRLAKGVGARHHTGSAPLGAVPGRFAQGLVCCPACGSMPVIRGGGVFSSRPQGGVIALELCLVGQRQGFPRGLPCRLCMVTCAEVAPVVSLWAPCDLLLWCTTFSEVMRVGSGGTFFP